MCYCSSGVKDEPTNELKQWPKGVSSFEDKGWAVLLVFMP